MAKNQVVTKWVAQTDEYNRKTKQARDLLEQFGIKGREAGQMIGQFDKILGTSIGTLGKLSVATAAVTGALQVMKDAFFKNEQNLDEWGRMVESAKSVYQGFLDTLNNGDFSGYFGTINDIIKAARDAYDALDELATYNAFNQINVQKTRAGLSNAINDYREGKGSKESVKAAGDALKNELITRQNKERDAYIKSVNQLAAEKKVDPALLLEALSGSYGSYETLKATKPTGTETRFTPGGMFGGSTAYEVAVPANKVEKLGQALRQLNDTELESLQRLGAQAEMTAVEVAQVDRQILRYTNGKNGTGRGGKGGEAWSFIPMQSVGMVDTGMATIAQTKKQIAYWTKEYENAGDDAGRAYAQRMIDSRNKTLEFLKTGIPKVTMPDTVVELPDVGEEVKESWQDAANAIGAVGSALANIQDPAVRVMGIIGEAIANIALGFAKATATDGGRLGTFGWIAAVAGGLGTMLSTISAIKSATEYHANGGIVGSGLGRGTDIVPAMLTPGELVLNRAQQANLATNLTNNGLANLRLETRVSGRDMRIILNNDTQSRGMGSFVLSR